VGVILTIVIVWALIAVIMLTRTLEAAQSIQTKVVDITGSVQGANKHLQTGCDPNNLAACPSTELPVLTQTENIAKQIDTAAKPLSGQAAQVLTAVGSINASVTTILQSAQSINATVHSIGASVGTIGSSVNTINASLSGVNSDVSTIRSIIATINGQAQTIDDLVVAIKGDTGTITGLAGGILTQAKGICADHPVKVAGILPVLGPICTGS
jgi:methyl-accepting chemotaxis protein